MSSQVRARPTRRELAGFCSRDMPFLGHEAEAGDFCFASATSQVTDEEAIRLLRDLAAGLDPTWPTATRIVRHRGGGGSDAWDVAVGSDIYVTKFANNPQEPARPSPRKVVTTELIAGRIGQLFDPAVCPITRVIDVPFELIEAEPILMSGAPAESGPACGSLLVPDTTETKAGGQLGSVPRERLAQIIAFQSLLQADDAAALVTGDGSWALSIDHGHYFGGGSWGNHHGPAAEQPRILVIGGLDAGILRDRMIWDPVLSELDAISDRDLASAFMDVPVEWGCDVGLLAPILGATSRRKERLREVVDAYC